MAMVKVLQGYLGVSGVEPTVLYVRWQMALDRLGSEEPAFSQGALRGSRERRHS